MNKTMIKILLKCILAVCIISIPFIFANYYITNYFIEHEKYFHIYDAIILNVLQMLFVITTGLIMRSKSKNIIIENKSVAKKYMLGSLIMFLAIVVLYMTGIYQDIYYIITFSLNIDKKPLFLFVCWEQILCKLLLLISLCIFICFTGAIRISRTINDYR